MKILPLGRAPIRSIVVEPFNCDRTHWQASYAGDEWTNAIEFRPVLPLRRLVAELREWPGRCGLPISVVDTLGKEVAA